MNSYAKAEKLFYRAVDSIKNKNYENAIKLLLEANNFSPNRKSILSNLCKVFFEVNDLKNLKKYLDQLLILFDNDEDVTLIEITYNIKVGNFDLAKKKAESLSEKNFLDALIFNLEINKRVYNYKETIRAYQKLLKTNTSNSEYIKSLIFMNLYSNPFDQKNYDNLVNKFKKQIKINTDKFEISENKEKNEKIKLGFIVNNYPHDPALDQVEGVLKELKKDSVILFAFLDNSKKNYSDNKNLKDIFNYIFSIEELSNGNASKFIAQKKLDFLFDISGYSANNRLEILTSKPAKKIISWAGFLCDTQINEVDYIILDKYCNFNNIEKISDKKKLFVSEIWSPYHLGKDSIPEIKNKKRFKDTFNYGSFANPLKYNDQLMESWSKIINNSSDTKILINYFYLGYPDSAKKLYDKFESFGVKKNRIIIEGLKSKKEILNDYNEVDLVLDTFPYNGMTSSFQSILMDTPILTLKGNRFISNCGYSINSNLNLNFLISENTASYVEKAVYLSQNPEKLLNIKNQISQRKDSSFLFNNNDFAKKLIQKLQDIKN